VRLPLQTGFLYLRYVLDPRTIWDWLQYYVKDHEVCAGAMTGPACRPSARLCAQGAFELWCCSALYELPPAAA
jgi:PRP38 family